MNLTPKSDRKYFEFRSARLEYDPNDDDAIALVILATNPPHHSQNYHRHIFRRAELAQLARDIVETLDPSIEKQLLDSLRNIEKLMRDR